MKQGLRWDVPPSFDGFVPDHVRELLKAQEPLKAVAYIMRFARKGNSRAMLAMADFEYDAGNKVASDEWVAEVEQLAASGDPDAPIYLSSAYRRGLGKGSTLQRSRKSLKMLELAAEHRNIVCAHALMSNYLYGLNGAKVSRRKFVYWAKKAAAWGSPTAKAALARMPEWPNVAPVGNDV
jgi:hypothetical protein